MNGCRLTGKGGYLKVPSFPEEGSSMQQFSSMKPLIQSNTEPAYRCRLAGIPAVCRVLLLKHPCLPCSLHTAYKPTKHPATIISWIFPPDVRQHLAQWQQRWQQSRWCQHFIPKVNALVAALQHQDTSVKNDMSQSASSRGEQKISGHPQSCRRNLHPVSSRPVRRPC